MSGVAPLGLKGIVKSVLSGDTIVLRNRAAPVPGQTPQERLLHLAYISAPRKDETYAVQSRDFLRTMLVGREVSFEVTYSTPATGSASSGTEFGSVVLSKTPEEQVDVGLAVVRAGAAKVRESKNAESEGVPEQTRKAELREAEEQAKNDNAGLWAEDAIKCTVNYSMPDDPDAFLSEYGKGKKVDACIEGINNGTTVRARLQIAPDTYQVVTIA